MVLRIKGFEVKVSFPLIALISFAVISNYAAGYALCFLSIIFHELGHLVMMKLFGVRVRGISLSLFDIQLLEEDRYSTSVLKDIIITIAGPCVNFLLYFLLRNIFSDFALINLFVGTFNTLPASSLDGGQALYLFLRNHTEKAEFILDIITLFVSFLLTLIGLLLLFSSKINFSLLFIGLYLFASVFIRKDKYL